MRITLLSSTFLLAGAMAIAPLHAQDAESVNAGKPEQVRAVLAKLTPAQKQQATQDAVKILSDTATPAADRVAAARSLALLQSPDSIPALRALLNDATLSDEARGALQRIASPAAASALLSGLRDATDAKIQIGIIESLGILREDAAIPVFKGFLKNETLADAALRALDAIGSADAFRTVRDATVPAAQKELQSDILLDIAEKLLNSAKSGANRSEIFDVLKKISSDKTDADASRTAWLLRFRFLEADAAVALKSTDANELFAASAFFNSSRDVESGKVLEKALPNADGALAVKIAAALASRQQTSAAPVLRARIAKEQNLEIKAELLQVLGSIGGADDVPLFTQLVLADSPIGSAANTALRQVRGVGVNKAFTDQIADTKTPKDARIALIEITVRRPLPQTAAGLIPVLADADQDVRFEALKAVERHATKAELDALKAVRAKLPATDDNNARLDKLINKLSK
ncbi:MAG: hypothetical protein LBV28_01055 [Puniceicoccales bacterium]|nr:hypothetical protein [Puniceicoccales bacterium]